MAAAGPSVRRQAIGRNAEAACLAGILLVFLVLPPLLGFGAAARQYWSDAFWSMAALAAAIRCFQAGAGPGAVRRHAWRLFGVGCAIWLAGILYWDYLELVGGRTAPFPTWADLGFLTFAPLLAAGLLLWRPRRPTPSVTALELSQLGIVLVCVVIVHVVVFYGPLQRLDHNPWYVATALAYPVLYMAVLAQSGFALWAAGAGGEGRPLLFVTGAVAVHAVAGSLYSYALLGRFYVTGGVLDATWVLGFGLLYLGASESIRIRDGKGLERGDVVSLQRTLRFGRLVPGLILLITCGVVLAYRENLVPETAPVLVGGVVVLAALVAVRDWAGAAMQAQLTGKIMRTNEELATLTHMAPVGILRTDRDGNCVYVSGGWTAVTGMDAQAAKGRGWIDGLHPEDRDRVVAAWREAAGGGAPFRQEYRFFRPDGEVCWVLGVAAVERSVSGEVAGLVGTITDITDRKAAELALQQSEARFKKFFESSPVGIAISRVRDGTILDVNEVFQRSMDWSRDQVVGRTLEELGIWQGAGDAERLLRRIRDEATVGGVEIDVRRRDGQTLNLLASVESLSIGGEPCLLIAAQDISDRKRAEAEMHKLSQALRQTGDGVMVTDLNGCIEYVNPAFERITGYTALEAVGKNPNILRSGHLPARFFTDMWATLLRGESYHGVFLNKRRDGTLYYEEKTITPLKDVSGRVTHYISSGRDISERMRAQEQLTFLAHHDPLTQLPNRTLLLDRLEQAVARARWRDRYVAVLFLDLDRFKTINDSLGHEVGDAILLEVARRLNSDLRDGDTVARFGGDEFVLILDDLADVADVGMIANKLLSAFTTPFEVNEGKLHMAASIGISIFPKDGEDPSALLKSADTAMYRAKEVGRNNYQYYSREMTARALERLTVENSLRRGLEKEQFRVFYQLQLDTRSGQPVGIEALLRWATPDRGIVEPDSFIHILEDTGMIIPVGYWVLNCACRQLARWRAEGWSGLRLSVNMSSIQIEQGDTAGQVSSILKEHGLPPDRLELEITETTLVRFSESTNNLLRRLDGLGVRIALDDFGTGYSSLAYLRQFPIHQLKIDRSFVRDVPVDADDAAIVRTIIAMADSLRLDLVAEGVETVDQKNFLDESGCHVMQGYLFGQPEPAETVERRLRRLRDSARSKATGGRQPDVR